MINILSEYAYEDEIDVLLPRGVGVDLVAVYPNEGRIIIQTQYKTAPSPLENPASPPPQPEVDPKFLEKLTLTIEQDRAKKREARESAQAKKVTLNKDGTPRKKHTKRSIEQQLATGYVPKKLQKIKKG